MPSSKLELPACEPAKWRSLVLRTTRLLTTFGAPGLHLLALAATLSLIRLYKLEVFFRESVGCHWCVANKALVHEAQFLLILAVVHWSARLASGTLLRQALRMVAVLMVLLAALDLFVLQQFYTRLTADMLLRFGREAGAIGSYVRVLFNDGGLSLRGAATGLLALAVVLRYQVHAESRAVRVWPLAALLVAVVATQPLRTIEYHTPYIKNSLEAFFDIPTRAVAYTPAFEHEVMKSPQRTNACLDGLDARPNIILLVIESLSVYQSSLFSGINNWLPEFDAASQDGLRLTNFFANGFTTEQGLIALLTGEPPIARPVQAWTSEFEQFNHPRESLPGLLGGRGYSTHFLTTGNLGFLNKGRWLRELGFHQVEGHDAPFYEGMRRFSFDAAPDDALYGRALQEIDGLAGSHPYFMTLETVTTHAPYVDPVKGVISQEGVVRYADRQLGRFVGQLRSRNYFRNGVLIIVGDHRAMTPMSEVERQHFGDRGFARIPLTVLGMNMHGEQKSAFSQTDLLPSICHWVGNGRQCLGSDQGVFLPAGRQTPSCIYTQRSYEPNDVVLQCGAQDHTVRLNGDETGYVVGPVGSPALLNEVNRLRLGMGLGY